MAELAVSSAILNKFRMMSAATAAPATAADGGNLRRLYYVERHSITFI
jgi:hypothetical protein